MDASGRAIGTGISPPTIRGSAARATILVIAASAFSALLGFGREIVNAHVYGARSDMDAFLNAATIPMVLCEVFSAALVVALVPIFSEYNTAGQSDEVKSLGSTVLNTLLILMSTVAVAGWFFAPIFVHLTGHGFSTREQAVVVQMVRWLVPGIVALSMSGVCTALLNAHNRFFESAMIWAVANVVTIAMVVALHRELGIFALVLGTVLGFFAQLAVQIPALLRHRLYRFELDLRHPGLAKSMQMLLPITIGAGAGQINLACDRYFASTLRAGTTASINYTTKISYLPTLLVAASIGAVIFPRIAGHYANADHEGIRRITMIAMRMVGFVVIPSATALIMLGHPIVQTLFERGEFGSAATASCATLVPFACLPLIANSYNIVLLRACYASKQISRAVAGSSAAVALNIVLSAALLPLLGARGLLLANGLAGLCLTFFLVALVKGLTGGFDWPQFLTSFSRVSIASGAMASVLWLLRSRYTPTDIFPVRALVLAGLVLVASIVFLFTARALAVGELDVVTDALRKRLGARVTQ